MIQTIELLKLLDFWVSHIQADIVKSYPIDSIGSQCYGVNQDKTPGGMFGISVSLSAGNIGDKTWMVKKDSCFYYFLCKVTILFEKNSETKNRSFVN